MNFLSQPLFEAALPGLSLAAAMAAILPYIDRTNVMFRTAIATIAIMISARYLHWRWFTTLPTDTWSIDWIVGIVFIVLETATAMGAVFTYVILTRTKSRSGDATANLKWLNALPKPPLVDVFICTYNEEEQILERTIIGALSIKYANHRVWVLDDGRRDWLRQMCDTLGCGYITRVDNSHAKAGNINNALRVIGALPDRPEYVSILDADFVPAPEFISRTLALFRSKDVGLVQTPQHFINADPMQSNLKASKVWPDEQRFFFDDIMQSKDAWGAAFCCGTSSLIKFDALIKIGGFPTTSVTEDYLVTLKLSEIGMKTVYLNERLSLGLAPEGLKEYITQRSRWCLGLVQICRGSDGPFSLSNKMPLIYRLSLIESFLFWSAGYAFRIVSLLIPMLYLLFDIRAVQADFADAIQKVLPYFVAQIGFVTWISSGRVLPILTDVSQLLAAPEILKSVAAGLWNPRGHGFKVTAKGGDRTVLVVQWHMLEFYLFVLGLTMLGILLTFDFDHARHLEESSRLALFWSWYNASLLIVVCFVAIELPRPDDELVVGQLLQLCHDGLRQSYRVVEFDGKQLRFDGKAPCKRGDVIDLVTHDGNLRGTISDIGKGSFSIAIEGGAPGQSALFGFLYAKRFNETFRKVRPLHVFSALLQRVFR